MKKKPAIRVWIQLILFILIALIAVNHTLTESGGGIPFLGSASLHAVCPFGGVVSLYTLITAGTFIKKIHESSMVLMYIVFASALFMGPLFCGWICPMGTFQEWIGWVGKKVFRKRFNWFIPYKVDKYLRGLRYVLLGRIVYMTAKSGTLLFQEIDPYYALFQFWTGEVALTAFITLGLVIILSLFVERPFCKYACPYGAVLGVFNFIRIVPLRRNPETCIDCGACDRACPVNIPVSKLLTVKDHQCISCYECTSIDGVCPVPETMEFRLGKFKAGREQASCSPMHPGEVTK